MRNYGSDFTMIATLMTKTRDQIKRKFKVLEKSNAALADAIFEKNINENTLKAITEHMEIEENDFFSVWAEPQDYNCDISNLSPYTFINIIAK